MNEDLNLDVEAFCAAPMPGQATIGPRKLTLLPYDENRADHQRDAIRIADFLWHSLPGGTLDRLVAEMMRLSASELVIGRSRATQ